MKLSFWHWVGIVIIISIILSFFLKMRALKIVSKTSSGSLKGQSDFGIQEWEHTTAMAPKFNYEVYN